MYCWGGFNYTNTPTKSFTSALFDSLYAGADATCGANAGSLSCWGSNQFGELASGDRIGSLTPRPVAGNLKFVQVEGYSDQICGLATDRSVYCWGFAWYGTTPELLTSNVPFAKFTFGRDQYCGIDPAQVAYCYGSNEDGKLGIGSVLATYVDRPTRVQPPENGETNFSEISAGGYQTCAIGLSGALYCWGRGEEIGIGVQENRVSPTLVSPPR
jgi:alpha-tubulin suppressor-like RCC1 family protein